MAQFTAICAFVVVIAALLLTIPSMRSYARIHRYEVGDYIPLFVNTVRPMNTRWYRNHSPFEFLDLFFNTSVHNLNRNLGAQPYFELPFCPPGRPIKSRKKSLGEILQGDCLTNTRYELNFKVAKYGELLCEKNLTREEVAMFRHAVNNSFVVHMYYNDIRIEYYLGVVEGKESLQSNPKYYLVKHVDFDVQLIWNHVEYIKIVPHFNSFVDITEDVGIRFNFTYSVSWVDMTFSSLNTYNWGKMMEKSEWPMPDKLREETMNSIQTHLYTYSIVTFWIGLLLTVIMPYLWSYFSRQKSLKQIHGEDCRCPPYSSLLGAILGTGTQLLFIICSIFLLAYIGVLNPCSRETWYICLVIYCLTSMVAGYMATSFHCRYTTAGWKECIFQTGVVYFFPAFITAVVTNIVAQRRLVISDPPQSIIGFEILLIWGFYTIVFLSWGGVVGSAIQTEVRPPCATTTSRLPRAVPQLSWYMRTPFQMFLGGLLPFMIIFRDTDTLYASMWNLKICGAFLTLLVDFIVVIAATILLGMSFSYSKQDQQWSWRSFLRGGSTAIFMFVYCIHFNLTSDVDVFPNIKASTYEEAFMKMLLILGYNACIFYAFFLVLGTIGYIASSIVVHVMYEEAQKNE